MAYISDNIPSGKKYIQWLNQSGITWLFFFLYLEQYLGKIYRKSPRILVQVSCQNRLCNCNVLRHLSNDYLKTLLSDVICFMVEMVLFCKGWARDDKSTIKSQGRTSSNIIGVRLIYYHTC